MVPKQELTDTDRLNICLRYGAFGRLGSGVDDIDYENITLEAIERIAEQEVVEGRKRGRFHDPGDAPHFQK